MKNKRILKEENIDKNIKKMGLDFRKITSNVFILVGLYYLLISAGVLQIKLIWLFGESPSTQKILFIAILLLFGGVMLNKDITERIKNVLR